MDNYPQHLAPEFEESGAVKTPFEEWWPKVCASFPNIPEEVARFWLHEHWSHSPFSWLPSSRYLFELVDFPSDRLAEIRSGWDNFKGLGECHEHGRDLIEGMPAKLGYPTSAYMVEHGDFPTPVIVLDNHDGHLSTLEPLPPKWEPKFPKALILVEGHRRLNMGIYLAARGRLKTIVKIYMMSVA